MTSLIAALEQIKRMAENGEYGIADVAGKALAQAVAASAAGELPHLPKPNKWYTDSSYHVYYFYSADQMREYARAALASAAPQPAERSKP